MFGPVELLFLPQMNSFTPKSLTFAVENKTKPSITNIEENVITT